MPAAKAPIGRLGLLSEQVGPGTAACAAVPVYAATVSTVLIALLVNPILRWKIQRSRALTSS